MVTLGLALGAGGCATPGPIFSWYHPQGGEYLFVYDKDECINVLDVGGLTPGTQVDGPFFQCMIDRGYYLVDGDVVIRGPEGGLSIGTSTLSARTPAAR